VSHPTEAPPVQAPTTIPSVPQVSGVYAVLQALQAGNPLMGGWGYLTWTGSVYHEAADLNSLGGGDADLGAWVVAPLDGVVTFVEPWDGWTSGFGSHVAVFVDDERAAQPCYVHLAHLARIDVAVGERVAAGVPLGTCGRSGNQGYAHCHAAWWYDVPPGGWNFWQTGYAKDWVAERTLDPGDWFWASVAKADALSGGGIAPEVVAMLSDWELLNWVMPDLWAWAGLAYDPEALTSKAWLQELRAGRYRGRPRTAARPYGDGRGDWVEHDAGVVVTRSDTGEWSWQG
jgi:hypothetical protein